MVKKITATLLTLCLLAGCKTQPANPSRAATLPTSVVCDNRHPTPVCRLVQAGGLYLQKGDKITIVLPTDRLFPPGDERLSPTASNLLNLTATILQKLPAVPASVTVFTDNTGNIRAQRILALKRAKQIVNYLWAAGISSQNLYPLGVAHKGYVATNRNIYAAAANRRVEIELDLGDA